VQLRPLPGLSMHLPSAEAGVELAAVNTAAHVTTRSVLVRSVAAIQGCIRDLERTPLVMCVCPAGGFIS